MSKVICYMVLMSWALAVVLASASTSGGRASYPRTNRGFKNAQLSTARGFGKRDRDAVLGNAQQQQMQQPLQMLEELFSSNARSYPNAWLVEELQSNPEMARLIVERFIDENGDGELTPDELFRRVYF